MTVDAWFYQKDSLTTDGGIRVKVTSAGQFVAEVFDQPTGQWLVCFDSATFSSNLITSKEVSVSPYAILSTDRLVNVDASLGAITANLPAITLATAGKVYYIRKEDSSVNTVTIAPNGSDTINGESSVILTSQGDVLQVAANLTKSKWMII